MGWLWFAMLAGVSLTTVLWWARPGTTGVLLAGAALLLAGAGYARQGRSALGGSPTAPRANHPAADTDFAAERALWLGQVGPEADLLAAADSLIRQGSPDYAIGILRAALIRTPHSMALWIGLGNALATYADGSVTPAASFAFGHAAQLAPGNPAPIYFLALAYAEGGDFDRAEHIWQGLLAATPPSAPYRPLIQQRLATLAFVRAMASARQ